MTTASLLQVIAQEASRFKTRPQDAFSAMPHASSGTSQAITNGIDTARGRGTGSQKTIRLNGGGTEYATDSGSAKTATGINLPGLADGSHLYMAIRKSI